ncbi:hypothetical protein Dimus_009675 [Dionaea muscipula]
MVLHLMFTVIFTQMAVILLLLFKTPLRKLLIVGLDHLKRGRGPVVVKTVAGTVFVVFTSTVYGIVDITSREVDPAAINPTDQVLMARNLLDASLMGFMLFLGLMIDRLHYYIRELGLQRKALEAAKKQSRSFEDMKSANPEEFKAMGEEITILKSKIKNLESECAAKTDEAKAAQDKVEAMKKQSEGLLLEYDKLIQDNHNLRSQLQDIDHNLEQQKKSM